MSLPEWQEMFGSGAETKRFRLVTKRGLPLLLLPLQSKIAARTLELYPAQTFLARSFKVALSLSIRGHLPTALPTVELPFSANAPIPDFIRRCASGDREFGILLGNANAPGRRWILMIFDADGRPWQILKTGVSPRARELIRAEAAILSKFSPSAGCFPVLRDTLETEISAVCMDYAPGCTPRAAELVGQTLTRWLRPEEKRMISDFPAWQRVRNSDAQPAMITDVENELDSTPLTPALSHGDFAPWNIREDNGKWTVLDWERGEESGMPGWDWLHFHIQKDVLVLKKSAPHVWDSTIRLMKSQSFRNYSAAAGISGKDRSILQSYLLHAIHVNRQTEGIETLKHLLAISRG